MKNTIAIPRLASITLMTLSILAATAGAQETEGSSPEATADSPADTAASLVWQAPAEWFIYAVIVVIFIGSLWAMLRVRESLEHSHWSLADALSESVETRASDENGDDEDEDNTVETVNQATTLISSSSRLIALMGTIMIMVLFLGFGIFALYAFAKMGRLPDAMDDVVNFLVAGMTLFAPYIVNKFSSLFKGRIPS
jgi:Na+/melibiose symporter-like transporter